MKHAQLQPADEILLKKRGITPEQIEEQLHCFATGFPFLEIRRAAAIGDGILRIPPAEQQELLSTWDNYLTTSGNVLKFVPASGAASRMFKDLFAFLESENPAPTTEFEKQFFRSIEKFAFYDDLNYVCITNTGKSIAELMAAGEHKEVVRNLLDSNGLNYGFLPKGLLKFHTYPTENRTPVQEHLEEGARHAQSGGCVNLHFTVSAEHRALFEKHRQAALPELEKRHNLKFHVSFSEQKPATDTIAADSQNAPFRENGELVFRPGGHGALIANLNELDYDVIFIKNIDNVVPDALKAETVRYKKLLGGLLISLQKQAFAYLKILDNALVSEEEFTEITRFCEERLNNHHPNINKLNKSELKAYLHGKLNRPIRICGMVKNEGEPGGGPFLTVNADGTTSPQILESAQINQANPADKARMMSATHFNPVDLVCGVKNYQGAKFDLLKYIDKRTGFISLKSKGGQELKALELPGLWNGAMSDWNTVFVEVPVATFNPVKTVNDLLRTEHQ